MNVTIPKIRWGKNAVPLEFQKQMQSFHSQKSNMSRTFRKTAACLSAKLKRVKKNQQYKINTKAAGKRASCYLLV